MHSWHGAGPRHRGVPSGTGRRAGRVRGPARLSSGHLPEPRRRLQAGAAGRGCWAGRSALRAGHRGFGARCGRHRRGARQGAVRHLNCQVPGQRPARLKDARAVWRIGLSAGDGHEARLSTPTYPPRPRRPVPPPHPTHFPPTPTPHYIPDSPPPPSCPAFGNAPSPLQCRPGCATCRAEEYYESGNFRGQVCLSCKRPLFLNPRGDCVQQCPQGSYFQFATATCQPVRTGRRRAACMARAASTDLTTALGIECPSLGQRLLAAARVPFEVLRYGTSAPHQHVASPPAVCPAAALHPCSAALDAPPASGATRMTPTASTGRHARPASRGPTSRAAPACGWGCHAPGRRAGLGTGQRG